MYCAGWLVWRREGGRKLQRYVPDSPTPPEEVAAADLGQFSLECDKQFGAEERMNNNKPHNHGRTSQRTHTSTAQMHAICAAL